MLIRLIGKPIPSRLIKEALQSTSKILLYLQQRIAHLFRRKRKHFLSAMTHFISPLALDQRHPTRILVLAFISVGKVITLNQTSSTPLEPHPTPVERFTIPAPSLQELDEPDEPVFPPLRLSQIDATIIAEGARRIFIPYWAFKEHNSFPLARPDLTWQQPEFNRGKFDVDQLERLMQVYNTVVQKRETGGDFHDFTPLDLAGLMLAVRFLVQQVRHGHIESPVRGLEAKSKRLLQHLENARKKAKRFGIKHWSRSEYDIGQVLWSDLLRWMRLKFLDCICLANRRIGKGSRRGFRLQIDYLLMWTRDELIDRDVKLPSEKEFRRLIRDEIAYVRRCRRPYSILELRKDPKLAGYRMVRHIEPRLEKMAKKKRSRKKK